MQLKHIMSLSMSYYLTTNLIIRAWTQVPHKYRSVPKTRDVALPTSWGPYTTPQIVRWRILPFTLSYCKYQSQKQPYQSFSQPHVGLQWIVERPLTKHTCSEPIQAQPLLLKWMHSIVSSLGCHGNSVVSVHYNQSETIGEDPIWGLVYCTFKNYVTICIL